MIGTILNTAAILIGSALGLLMGSRIPEKLRETVLHCLGLFTLAVGLKMFLETQNALIVLGSLVLGAIIGELLHIEDGLARLGSWLQSRVPYRQAHEASLQFSHGFLTASLLFCIGPIAVLGSIQEGLHGDYQLLAVKSVLDGLASVAFAASMGAGVVFSAIPLFLYQGGITLLAAMFEKIVTDAMLSELTATGGVLMMAIAISSILEIKKIRTGNLLPGIFLAPFFVLLVSYLGISFF